MRWSDRLRTLVQEPIVPFLIVGVGLYGLQGALDAKAPKGDKEIVISNDQAVAMVQAFTRTWQRPPSQEELESLFDEHVRTEVFVREAMALGLDRNDTIVRRRLRQKMEFVSHGEQPLTTPSVGQLQAHLEAHPERFSSEPRFSFQQVFLDPSLRGEQLNRDAEALLAQLNQGDAAADLSALGDPLAMASASWESESRSEMLAQFGSTFTDALQQQPKGRWVGPISSAYGMHLVHVSSIVPGELPSLEQVRDGVLRDWQEVQRQQHQESYYRDLLARYSVRVPQF
ncbi:peptidyl-prolyl cis-trans isomerase (PPIASE) protein family [Synechococcus sp. BIOS-U3-1]|uniref:peptidylprolyl isomerase n=1 Tax=Synechococcus sp. BIOS-U3-1 TaxID=1400865 RepID=UPI0016487847|nr:peptidylprolyl isomerase [Synechococcus sp. BIOS-U3-1]QNI60102.1 peptidyl-prolyl cis-trans isomerase (PPIASE) protein family [Synechococcus sp. BIOS-U3-1]